MREIRAELVALAVVAYERGDTPDPIALDRLADELAWAAAIAHMYSGDSSSTSRLERAVAESAELARLAHQRRQAVAA